MERAFLLLITVCVALIIFVNFDWPNPSDRMNSVSTSGIEKKHRRIAGCLPVRAPNKDNDGYDGLPEVMLITSRSDPSRYVFPKGGVKKRESASEAARRETWEEAGVRGDFLYRLSLVEETENDYEDDEIFCHDGESDDGDSSTQSTSTSSVSARNSEEANKHGRWYVLWVKEQADEWPEKDQRERVWMSIREARNLKNVKQNMKMLLVQLEELFVRRQQDKLEFNQGFEVIE